MKESVSLMAALAFLYVLEIAECGEQDKIWRWHTFKTVCGVCSSSSSSSSK